jgi:hypothetical protein
MAETLTSEDLAAMTARVRAMGGRPGKARWSPLTQAEALALLSAAERGLEALQEEEGCSSGSESAVQGTQALNPDSQSPDGWRPIETAPLGRKSILVWCPDYHNIYVVSRRYGDEDRFEHFGPGADPLREEPTHWQPLPQPPHQEGDAK